MHADWLTPIRLRVRTTQGVGNAFLVNHRVAYDLLLASSSPIVCGAVGRELHVERGIRENVP